MPNVVRFALSTARTLNVPGAGQFVEGVLDVDANNLTLVSRTRYLVRPYGATEIGIVDSATPYPSLPAVPVPPPADPYPMYLDPSEILDSETGQIRTDKLPDRLSETELRAAYGSAATRLINAADRGVSPTKTATENTALIQQAITDAEAAGSGVLLPWCPPGQYIDIDGKIDVAVGGIRITGHGPATRIRQNTFPEPCFEVFGPNTVVERMVFSNVPFDANALDPISGLSYKSTPWRGETKQSWSCGVWIGADNCTVRDVEGYTIGSVVRTSPWNIALDIEGTEPVRSTLLENILGEDVVFVICPRGVYGLTFRNIRGSYDYVGGINTPPHLLYFTTHPTIRSRNISGSDCFAYDGANGQPWQFKSVIGGTFTNLVADGCSGVANLTGCEDVRFSGLVSTNDTWGNLGGALAFVTDAGLGCKRVVIEGLTLELVGNGRAVYFSNESADCVLRNSRISAARTTDDAAPTTGDIEVRGTRQTLDNVEVVNTGPASWGSAVAVISGDGHRIIAPRTAGEKNGIRVQPAVTGASIEDYRTGDLQLAATGGQKKIDTTTATVLTLPKQAQARTAVATRSRGVLAENMHPQTPTVNTALTNGTLYLLGVGVLAGDVITHVLAGISAPGAAGGQTVAYGGLYDTAGNLLAASANQGAAWESAGLKEVPLETAWTAPADGMVYVAYLATNTTTNVSMMRSTGATVLTEGRAGYARPVHVGGTGLTALPTAATLGSGAITAWWAGVMGTPAA